MDSKKYILDCYCDYRNFMQINKYRIEMPLLNVKKSDSNENALAYVVTDEISNKIANIYYSSKWEDLSTELQHAKLFHEFTHIVDCLMIKRITDEKTLLVILATYSEFHASQVELYDLLGIKNVTKFDKIDLENKLISEEREWIPASQAYLGALASSSVIIDKETMYYYDYDMLDYFKKYFMFEARAMYTLGKYEVCKKVSTEKIPNIIEKTYGKFFPYIFNIRKCFSLNQLPSIPKYRSELWEKFKSEFPNKFMNDFPDI